jgi:X-X-X-Leu-X-X-Gly heptad repeat protein
MYKEVEVKNVKRLDQLLQYQQIHMAALVEFAETVTDGHDIDLSKIVNRIKTERDTRLKVLLTDFHNEGNWEQSQPQIAKYDRVFNFKMLGIELQKLLLLAFKQLAIPQSITDQSHRNAFSRILYSVFFTKLFTQIMTEDCAEPSPKVVLQDLLNLFKKEMAQWQHDLAHHYPNDLNALFTCGLSLFKNTQILNQEEHWLQASYSTLRTLSVVILRIKHFTYYLEQTSILVTNGTIFNYLIELNNTLIVLKRQMRETGNEPAFYEFAPAIYRNIEILFWTARDKLVEELGNAFKQRQLTKEQVQLIASLTVNWTENSILWKQNNDQFAFTIEYYRVWQFSWLFLNCLGQALWQTSVKAKPDGQWVVLISELRNYIADRLLSYREKLKSIDPIELKIIKQGIANTMVLWDEMFDYLSLRIPQENLVSKEVHQALSSFQDCILHGIQMLNHTAPLQIQPPLKTKLILESHDPKLQIQNNLLSSLLHEIQKIDLTCHGWSSQISRIRDTLMGKEGQLLSELKQHGEQLRAELLRTLEASHNLTEIEAILEKGLIKKLRILFHPDKFMNPSDATVISQQLDSWWQAIQTVLKSKLSNPEFTDLVNRWETEMADLWADVGIIAAGLKRLDDGIGRLDDGIGRLDAGIGRLDAGIGRLDAGLARIDIEIEKFDQGDAQLGQRIDHQRNENRQMHQDLDEIEQMASKMSENMQQLQDAMRNTIATADQTVVQPWSELLSKMNGVVTTGATVRSEFHPDRVLKPDHDAPIFEDDEANNEHKRLGQ